MVVAQTAVKTAITLLATVFLIFGLGGDVEVDIDIDRITEQAEEEIIEHVNEHYLDYVNEDANIVFQEEAIFEQVMEDLLDIHEVPEEMTEDIMDKVWENLRPDLWQQAEDEAIERYNDYLGLRQGYFKYNGVSQQDFL